MIECENVMECEFDREYYVTLFEDHCTSPCSQIELETEEGESEVVKCPHTHAAAALFAPSPPGRGTHARRTERACKVVGI